MHKLYCEKSAIKCIAWSWTDPRTQAQIKPHALEDASMFPTIRAVLAAMPRQLWMRTQILDQHLFDLANDIAVISIHHQHLSICVIMWEH
jgi:hypothetical protein